jgi:4-aminobutyrate aminotransferase / (S)-3-amino-2-methylpropionate transaminase / 5-aminovalerate transaminase
MDAAHSGAVGGTYIGNPVALAAACAVLDVLAEENLVARAQTIGETIRARMLSWQERHAQIGDVRGLGAMLAIELVHGRDSKEPAPELTEAVIDAALARGLILLKAGVHGNCIRVLCPLTITDLELEEALEVWGEALATVLP